MSNSDNRMNRQERIEDLLTSAMRSISRAIPWAQDDAKAIGYKTSHGRYQSTRATSESSQVEASAERLLHGLDFAGRWLREVEEAAKQLHVLANMAEAHWPPRPKTGEKIGDVVVGARGNDVEICHFCQEPVPEGRLPSGHSTIIRIDGNPYHRATCYRRIWREQRGIKESA